jgi:hypothetical protein
MENLMRILGAAILAASLLVTNAFAAETLKAGKPAGVKKAQMEGNNALLIIGGIGLAGLGHRPCRQQQWRRPYRVHDAAISTRTNTP